MTGVTGLAEVVLWVHDMGAALNFYSGLFGLEVMSPPELPNKFLKASDGDDGVPEMIVLVPHPDPSMSFPREKAKRVLNHLAFRVDGSAYDRLQDGFAAAGMQVRAGVHPVLKGVRTFYVDDPDGNECECISPDPAAEAPSVHVTRAGVIPTPSDAALIRLAGIAVQVEEWLAPDHQPDMAPVGLKTVKNDRRRAMETILVLLADSEVRSYLAEVQRLGLLPDKR